MTDVDPDALFVAIERLARAQCDVEQIKASLRTELLLDPAALTSFFELDGVRAWVDACALAGQGDLQLRMWEVAREFPDQPVGATMARWLAINFLGHAKSDLLVEVRRILAELKSDPTKQAQLLAQAQALMEGNDA